MFLNVIMLAYARHYFQPVTSHFAISHFPLPRGRGRVRIRVRVRVRVRD